MILGIISIVFFGLIIYFFISTNYSLLALFFTAKYLLDVIFFAPSFTRNRRAYSLLFLPFYQLFFPFYYLFLLMLLPFFSPKWKGRNAGITKQQTPLVILCVNLSYANSHGLFRKYLSFAYGGRVDETKNFRSRIKLDGRFCWNS